MRLLCVSGRRQLVVHTAGPFFMTLQARFAVALVASSLLHTAASAGEEKVAFGPTYCASTTLAKISAEFQARIGSGCMGDIGEHMPTLMRSALNSSVSSVSEVGVRQVFATWAFLEAARRRHVAREPPLSIFLYDITMSGAAKDVVGIMQRTCPAIPVTFVEGDDLNVTIQPTDVMLLDTWHSYRQLSRELAKIPMAVQKALFLHDTVTYGRVDEGESGHGGKRIDETQFAGLPRKAGLQPALGEFLGRHAEWYEAHRYENCNGLTVLCRTPRGTHEPIVLPAGSMAAWRRSKRGAGWHFETGQQRPLRGVRVAALASGMDLYSSNNHSRPFFALKSTAPHHMHITPHQIMPHHI